MGGLEVTDGHSPQGVDAPYAKNITKDGIEATPPANSPPPSGRSYNGLSLVSKIRKFKAPVTWIVKD